MADVSFSEQELALESIAIQHQRVTQAIFSYFDAEDAHAGQLALALESRELARTACLEELDHTSSMTALAALEAAIRVDYLSRVYAKRKDAMSRTMRALHAEKSSGARLDEDLLELWKRDGNIAGPVISEVRASLRYRHWLAHGRYWVLKAGRQYDFTLVYELADAFMAGMDDYNAGR